MSKELHDRQTEEALLGAMLLDPSWVQKLDLETHEFYYKKHRWIWDGIQALDATLDYVTLQAYLDQHDQLKEIGGPAFLTKLVSATASSLHAEGYAKTIKDLARRRRDVRVGEMIINDAHNGGVDSAKMIDLLSKNEAVKGEAQHIAGFVSTFYDLIEERHKNPDEIWGMKTGFLDLDKLLGGLQKQQTTVIAGKPGVGKTLLVNQIAYQLALSGHKIAIYSFEMDAGRIISRLVSAFTGIETRLMYTGQMNGEWEAFTEQTQRLTGLPIYISDAPGMTTSALRSDVSRLKALAGVDVVVLDYLNLLTDRDGVSKNENTANKSQRFRSICREFDVHGLTVQSMNKEGIASVAPNITAISGPADVAFDADNVFFLSQDTEAEMVVNMLPGKIRDGDRGRAPIKLLKRKRLPKFENYANAQRL